MHLVKPPNPERDRHGFTPSQLAALKSYYESAGFDGFCLLYRHYLNTLARLRELQSKN